MLGFAFLLAWTLTWTPMEQALAWGQEGHSIVAEIAQRRLDANTREKIQALLKDEAPEADVPQIALASIASWADDYRSKQRHRAVQSRPLRLLEAAEGARRGAEVSRALRR
jgi:hypothetical protein